MVQKSHCLRRKQLLCNERMRSSRETSRYEQTIRRCKVFAEFGRTVKELDLGDGSTGLSGCGRKISPAALAAATALSAGAVSSNRRRQDHSYSQLIAHRSEPNRWSGRKGAECSFRHY